LGSRAASAVMCVASAACAVALLVPPARAQETGSGTIGEWTVAWKYDEMGGNGRSDFRLVMGPDRPFPYGANVISVGRERTLVFFDDGGRIVSRIELGEDEDALAAEDGSAYLRWTDDPLSRPVLHYRYFRRDQLEPDWEASATGEPLLLAPDGSLFVCAAADTGHDGFARALVQPSGTTQVVDAAGHVLGEYPILPTYVRLTGDHARIAMLHSEELVVLRANGHIDWTAHVPVDAILLREGLSQLEAAAGLIVVTGTGETEDSTVLKPKRRGTIRAFDDAGRVQWIVDQPDTAALWFQVSCALSPDGGTLATFHTDEREIVVQAWDARSGAPLWRRTLTRQTGSRCLSVAPQGELVVLASGDLRTSVVAWDREGTEVWEGTLPFPFHDPRITADGLLVSPRWMVKLTPEWPE
jgi:outer membrane protein assembly factor BamB